jgi:hypothetical protein
VPGEIALAAGEPDAAHTDYAEASRISQRMGTPRTSALSLEGLARAARERPGGRGRRRATLPDS